MTQKSSEDLAKRLSDKYAKDGVPQSILDFRKDLQDAVHVFKEKSLEKGVPADEFIFLLHAATMEFINFICDVCTVGGEKKNKEKWLKFTLRTILKKLEDEKNEK